MARKAVVVTCPECGAEMPPAARYCPGCGTPRSAVRERLMDVAAATGTSYEELVTRDRAGEPIPALPDERRTALLQTAIEPYLANGYRVVSQTPTTAQLVKPKTFSALLAILLFVFLFVVGFIIYLLIYMAEKDKTVYLSVDAYGTVTSQ